MQSLNILILEEDLSLKKDLVPFLEKEGHKVEYVNSAQKSLELIKYTDFDVMLVDYKLHDMTGISFIKTAAKLSKNEFISVIMSSVNSLEVAFEVMREGISDYLIKPFCAEDFMKNIEKAFDEYTAKNRRQKKLRENTYQT